MFDMVPFRRGHNGVTKRGDVFENFMNSFWDDDFFGSMNLMNNSFKVDLQETDNNYIIAADLPGVKKDAINLGYENNYLTISAKRDDVVEDKNDNYVRRERHYGEFKRSFYIDNVDDTKIDASFNDGVLKINLAKKDPSKVSARKIDIH